MILWGILIGIFGGLLAYWYSGYSPLKSQFKREMIEHVQSAEKTSTLCTKEEIERLPIPLQRYCHYMGLENTPKYQSVNALFHKTNFIFNDEKNIKLKMDYDLWLFNKMPFRTAYCGSKLYGMPFEGMDYCNKDKEGGMKGVLGKMIPLFDVHDRQGYRAGLISWVAEGAVLNPSILLSDYLIYRTIDDHHVEVTIKIEDVSGTGMMTINDEGKLLEFYSDERQVEMIDGIPTAIGWRCECEDYQVAKQLLLPTTIRAIKVYPDKEVVYFESNHFEVTYY